MEQIPHIKRFMYKFPESTKKHIQIYGKFLKSFNNVIPKKTTLIHVANRETRQAVLHPETPRILSKD